MTRLMAAVLLAAAITTVAENTPVDSSWVVPPKARQQQNPLKDNPDAALGGKKIFTRSCVMCHGDEKHARKSKAADLSSEAVQSEPDGSLFWRISNGNARTGMPSFNSLPEPQRWQLVLYIRTLAGKK